jgi:hypothetical protein
MFQLQAFTFTKECGQGFKASRGWMKHMCRINDLCKERKVLPSGRISDHKEYKAVLEINPFITSKFQDFLY